MIDAGEEVIANVDQSGLPVTMAFWLFDREINEWRLTFASPAAESQGHGYVYRKISEVMRENWGTQPPISFLAIKVIDDDSDLARRLKKVPGVSHQIGRTKFDRQVIDGRYIDDALIYRAA